MMSGYVTPFSPGHPSVNAPSLALWPEDRLDLFYFGGSWEGREDVALWHRRLVRDGGSIHAAGGAGQVARVAGRTLGNSVPIVDEAGTLWLYFVVSRPCDWRHAEVWRTRAAGGSATFEEPEPWRTTPGTLVGTPAVRSPDGGWLLPVYDETAWTASVVRLDRHQNTVGQSAPVATPRGCIQLALAAMSDGQLVGLLRTRDGRVFRTVSTDGGATFSQPVATPLPNPNARIACAVLREDLLVVYNPASEGQLHLEPGVFSSGRTVLRAALSADAGLTFPRHLRRDVATGAGEYAYPWLLADGLDALLAYQENRTCIRVVPLSPSWLREPHPLASPETYDEAVDDLVRASAPQEPEAPP
jgi:predicted neuraminidase